MATDVRGEVPGAYVRLLFEHLEARAIDARALLGEPVPDAADRGLVRYPARCWCELLDKAARHLDDPLLGLRLGQAITPAHFGIMGYVLLASANMAAALQRMERYQRLIYDISPMRYGMDGDTVTLAWGVERGRPGALADECGIAALVQFARHITGRNLSPLKVCFVNPEPADVRPYLRFFGCPVRFAQCETVVQFPLAMLNLPLRQPDPALVGMLEQQADALLAGLPDIDDFEQTVRRCIAGLLHEGEPSLERVASELHMSARTLRRRLEERGHRFRTLRDDTLRRLAETYLADPRLTLADIAQLLGFSEQSAFGRSFLRWAGSSPGRYRRRLASLRRCAAGPA
ncbi:AraC family transcriptional regulator [Noviherbaspirillum sp. UKPF54]|uniref:AraC family transcriptional regulator n=1 Tax=Noviherbaspirillum sp. UKPF54 TaxID=2601898 RepID=UPI0011B19EA5|nr:AraC family transcriptional regulator [Noviherbaspirillum sp. UKPF54]QDZ26781.1 AraC family transcriptional regulator [Noviherbaspirillum sp. UKPF54]